MFWNGITLLFLLGILAVVCLKRLQPKDEETAAPTLPAPALPETVDAEESIDLLENIQAAPHVEAPMETEPDSLLQVGEALNDSTQTVPETEADTMDMEPSGPPSPPAEATPAMPETGPDVPTA